MSGLDLRASVLGAELSDIDAESIDVTVQGTTGVGSLSGGYDSAIPQYDVQGRATDGYNSEIIIRDGRKYLVK